MRWRECRDPPERSSWEGAAVLVCISLINFHTDNLTEPENEALEHTFLCPLSQAFVVFIYKGPFSESSAIIICRQLRGRCLLGMMWLSISKRYKGPGEAGSIIFLIQTLQEATVLLRACGKVCKVSQEIEHWETEPSSTWLGGQILGGKGYRITWAEKFETSLSNTVRLCFKTNQPTNIYTRPVIPTLRLLRQDDHTFEATHL